MPRKIIVKGLGAICAAGASSSDLEKLLFQPHSLFHAPKRFDLDIDVVVAETKEEWLKSVPYSANESMTGKLAYLAAKECLEDSQENGAKPPQACILGTSAGGQGNNESFFFSLLGKEKLHEFDFHKQGVVASPIRQLANSLDIKGEMLTISTACTSSAISIAIASQWIADGKYDSVLVGGADELCATTISGFHSLLLTTGEACKPFGPSRPGMTLGEGAGFLLLEVDNNSANSKKDNYWGEILGYGMSSDAYHLTAPSIGGAGAILTMKKALKKANLTPSQINWINAHGTGTDMNDRAEAEAINSIFGLSVPVSSNKGLFGHTLGGAGAIEAVVSFLSIKNKLAPENFFSYELGEDCNINIVPKNGIALTSNPKILSNSFGFGGSNCSLIFGK